MNWTTLYQDFLNGKPDAVQAIVSCLTGLLTAIGTGFVAASFRSQNRINKDQIETNRYLKENHVKQIKPIFDAAVVSSKEDANQQNIVLSLQNASAFNIRIVTSMGDDKSQKIYAFNKWLVNKNTLTFKDWRVRTDEYPYSSYLTIYYEDEEGRKYSQEFNVFDVARNINKVSVHLPQLHGIVSINYPDATHKIDFDETV